MRDSWITEATEAIIIVKSELLVSSVRSEREGNSSTGCVALIHPFLMKFK